MNKTKHYEYNNPEEFFKKMEEVWTKNYKVEATANPITKIYTIKVTSLKESK